LQHQKHIEMEEKEFKIEINATPNKVWYVLWDSYLYQQWTAAFCEGSYAVTNNWEQNSRVHFLSPSGDGMYSDIISHITNCEMCFVHRGNIKNYQEQLPDNEVKKWTGAKEKYSLKQEGEKTVLTVSLDIFETYSSFFESTMPKALENVKNLSENFYITVQSLIAKPIETVWQTWNNPDDIMNWNAAAPTWHTPKAINKLQVAHDFVYTMAAKDGSTSFDFQGTYTKIEPNKTIEYVIADGRRVKITFEKIDNNIKITEAFEPENSNPLDLQRAGWQSILDNFKFYCESLKS
jgi:uncharacterized protein YndB with AHSA1/START domain